MDVYKYHKSPKSLSHYEQKGKFPGLYAEEFNRLLKVDTDLVAQKYFEDHEKFLKHVPSIVATYVIDLLGRPAPQYEHILATNANWALDYATQALHGRFRAGEDAIASKSETAFLYAKSVLNRRWKRAEPVLKNGEVKYKHMYERLFGVDL